MDMAKERFKSGMRFKAIETYITNNYMYARAGGKQGNLSMRALRMFAPDGTTPVVQADKSVAYCTI